MCVGQIGVGNNQFITGKTVRQFRFENKCTCTGISQIFFVRGTRHETDTLLRCVLQGRNLVNQIVRIADQLSIKMLSQVAQCKRLVQDRRPAYLALLSMSVSLSVISNAGEACRAVWLLSTKPIFSAAINCSRAVRVFGPNSCITRCKTCCCSACSFLPASS